MRFDASFFNIVHVIDKSKPDLIVLRGKGISERKACIVAFLFGIPTVLYNQEPLYKPEIKSKVKRFLKKIYNWFVPHVRYTPVQFSDYGVIEKKQNLFIYPHTYFVPFAGEEVEEAESRIYLKQGHVSFLMVGKYREYKTHRLLVDALVQLPVQKRYSLTFLGQCKEPEEIRYLEELKQYVLEKGLSDKVHFITNIKHNQMKEYYLQHDVLILPTRHEAASISVLEAMHHGMSVISTSRNGTASYVDHGESGFVFESGNASDLREKIECYISDSSLCEKMGKCALARAKLSSSRQAYFSAFKAMIQVEFPAVARKMDS